MNLANLKEALAELVETTSLPDDPYIVPTENNGLFEKEYEGQIPSSDELMDNILEPHQKIDLVGVYSGGRLIEPILTLKVKDSGFLPLTFSSTFPSTTPSKCRKGQYAGSNWDQKSFLHQVNLANEQLKLFAKPEKRSGRYKAYFAPAAVQEILR